MLRSQQTEHPISASQSLLNLIARETAELMHYSGMSSYAIGEQLLKKFADTMPEISQEMCNIALEDSSYSFASMLFARHGLIPNQQAQEKLRLEYLKHMESKFSSECIAFDRYQAIVEEVGNLEPLMNDPRWGVFIEHAVTNPVSRTEFHVCDSSKGPCVIALRQSPNESPATLQEKLNQAAGEPVLRRTSTLSRDEVVGFLQVPVSAEAGRVYYKCDPSTEITLSM